MIREPTLARALRMRDSTLLVIGSMIGTGIFLTTSLVAQELPSPWLILTAWIIGGIFAIAGALTFAELGAMFPSAGGHYVYIRQTFGPLWGFLDGWLSFVVAFPCSIAFMAVGLAQYTGSLVPLFSESNILARIPMPWGELGVNACQLAAVTTVLSLTAVNCLALRIGRKIHNSITFLKLLCLLALPVAGICSGHGAWAHMATSSPLPLSWKLLPSLGAALIGISFAYLGWDASTYMAAETKQPLRTLPRSLALGTSIVVLLYLLFNFFLLYALPLSTIATSSNVARDAAIATLGPTAATVITCVIILCILGAMDATIIAGPRICYAMARDRLFFRRLGTVNPKARVPRAAMITQGIWSSVVIMTGTFEGILLNSVFAILLLSVIAALAVFVLRHKQPERQRPYRTWGYPFVPLLYCAGSVAILLNALAQHPMQSAASLIAVTIGVAVYGVMTCKNLNPKD